MPRRKKLNVRNDTNSILTGRSLGSCLCCQKALVGEEMRKARGIMLRSTHPGLTEIVIVCGECEDRPIEEIRAAARRLDERLKT
jgi:hypothetical protein